MLKTLSELPIINAKRALKIKITQRDVNAASVKEPKARGRRGRNIM